MKYIDSEKLIAEIERLKSQLVRGACASQIVMETACKEEAYNEVLAFIDSLPAESSDFEAEWERYSASRKDDMRTNAVTMNVKEVALYFAKWGRKQVLTAKPSEELEEEIHRYFKELEKSDCVSNTRRLAKHFAEWGAEHLKSNH